MIDDREESFPLQNVLENQKLIRTLCHRKFGIGADGVIFLQKDLVSDFRMRIFNADGSEAESCGNGLRCLFKFLQELGFPNQKYTIATGKNAVEGFLEKDEVFINMKKPKNLRLSIQTKWGDVHFVDSGVPHIVQIVPDVQKVDVLKIGAFLRGDPQFQPKGANVNFVSFASKDTLFVRTYERGVEGETLACGTGAVAVSRVIDELYPPSSSHQIIFPGGPLEIFSEGKSYWMKGTANRIFSGSVCGKIFPC